MGKKVVSGVPPPPREFFMRCTKCGTYRISEETARKFLTEKLNKKLDRGFQEGIYGATLSCKEGCPVCKPNGTFEITLLALRPRKH